MAISRFVFFIFALLYSLSLTAAATIAGTVTSQASSLPISGTTITLIKGSSQIIATTTTAVDGTYSLTGINPGQYTVTANASGFQEGVVGVKASNNQTTTVNFALLSNPGTTTGTVTDANTTLPIAGALVEVTLNDEVIFSTFTDGAGNYTILDVPPGFYVMLAHAATYQTGIVGANVQPNMTTTVDFALLSNPGTIAGNVTDANTGQPIVGATIDVSLNNEVIFSTLTDIVGNYTAPDLAPGSYLVFADADTYQDEYAEAIVESNMTTTVNFALQTNPGTIEGTVTDANTSLPIAGAAIGVFINGEFIFFTFTDSSGNYTITGFAPDSYLVRAQATDYQTGIAEATVQSDQTTIVNFALQPNPGAISGTVTDANTTLPISGAAIGVYLNNDFLFFTFTDALGRYTITGVPPGSYEVHALAINHQMEISNATVLANQTTTVNFALQTNPSTLQGQITNALTGSPVRRALVSVFQGNTLMAFTLSDSNGNYVIGNLPSGSFSLRVLARGFYVSNTNFSVGVGDTVTVNVALTPNSPPRNLTGRIIENRFLLQEDRIHHIQWTPSQDPTVIFYKVYRNGTLVATIPANGSLSYDDHNRSSKIADVYSVNSVNTNNNESTFATITLQ